MSARTFVGGEVRVQVPATSANLGPGFDTLGLALALHDRLSARIVDDGLEIDVQGEGSAGLALDETHLVVRAMRRTFAELRADPSGLALTCRNAIPHARGLGSSAAAIVAGILLARGLVTGGAVELPDADVLALAADIEGHADNVAPCLLGGLTVAWRDGGRFRALRREPDPALGPVALVPPTGASTAVARALLPATVPHADAVFAAARSALLVAAITEQDPPPGVLLAATDDTLHQPYRAPSMPDSAALVARLRADGIPAVISGAGPTVLALTRAELEVEQVVAAAPAGWSLLRLAVDRDGARADTGNTPVRPGVAAL